MRTRLRAFLMLSFGAGVGACAQILGADYHLGSGIPSCGPLEAPSSSKTCERVGIAECAEGFETDNQGSCVPILPAETCQGRDLGAPGAPLCRPMGSCFDRFHTGYSYENLPPRQLYVDANLPTEGDGSLAAPLKSITKALELAGTVGATLFIAPGDYPEALTIRAPMGLLGGCQESVNIRPPPGLPGIRVESPGGTVSLGKLHIIGGAPGISVTDAAAFSLTTIWIESPEGPGVVLENGIGTTKVQTSSLLIDGAVGAGILTYGATIGLDGTSFTLNDPGITIRRTKPFPDGSGGNGVALHAGLTGPLQDVKTRVPSEMNVKRMVLEDNAGAGLFVEGSHATIRESVIQGTRANGRGEGRGVVVQREPLGPISASLTLADSVVADNHDAGVLIVDSPAPLDGTAGVTALIDRTVIRGGGDGASPSCHGNGLRVRSDGARSAGPDATAAAVPSIVVRNSVIDGARESGIHVETASVSVENSIIRGTRPNACDGRHGDGLAVYADSRVSADVTVSTTRVEDSTRAAVASFGAKVTLDGLIAEGCGTGCIVETDRGGARAAVSTTTSLCGPSGGLEQCGSSRSVLEPAIRGGNGCSGFAGNDVVCFRLCLESLLQRLATTTDLDKSIAPVSKAVLWPVDDLGLSSGVAGEDGCLELGGLPPNTDVLLAWAADGVDTNGYLPHLVPLHTGATDSVITRLPTSPNIVWSAWPGVVMDPRVSGYLGVLVCPPVSTADIGKTECIHQGIDGVSLRPESGLPPEVRYTSSSGAPDPSITAYSSTATAVFVNVPPGLATFSVLPPAGRTVVGCNMDHRDGWRTLRMIDADTAEIPMRRGFLSATILYCDVQ